MVKVLHCYELEALGDTEVYLLDYPVLFYTQIESGVPLKRMLEVVKYKAIEVVNKYDYASRAVATVEEWLEVMLKVEKDKFNEIQKLIGVLESMRS